jgi:hypothetical protein
LFVVIALWIIYLTLQITLAPHTRVLYRRWCVSLYFIG